VQYDATDGECFVFTYKEGMLSRVAHDLKLRCERFTLTLEDDRVEATFDPTSFAVVHALKQGKPNPGSLSDKDKRQIIENLRRDVLDARKHPEIRFVSEAVTRDGNALRVQGQLSLNGVTRPLTVTARRVDGRWNAEVDLRQPDFGIKPYTALMGAIRIKPAVKVRVSVPAT
jgi:hypothetical protein